MMDVLSAIESRRSIRGYTDEALTDAEIAALVAAATQSPTAVNRQSWHFTVVTNAEFLEKFNSDLRDEMHASAPAGNRGRFNEDKFNVFYHAPACIFLSCPSMEENRWAQVDCGIAVENIALAAVGLGLGSVILGLPAPIFAGDKADYYRAALKMPEGHDFAIAIAVGHPAMTKEAHPVLPGKVDYLR